MKKITGIKRERGNIDERKVKKETIREEGKRDVEGNKVIENI